MADRHRLGASQPAPKPPSDADERELDALRDRLNADDGKVTDNLSTIVRTVATGLALITYTFLTADKASPFIAAHFRAMRLASILGLLALLADALQYLSAYLQNVRFRYLVVNNKVPETVEGVVQARTNLFYWPRLLFFILKMSLTAVGTYVVIRALLGTSPAVFTVKP